MTHPDATALNAGSALARQRNRMTIIDHEFVVTEEDLAAEIKEEEIEALDEEIFDQANITEDSSEQQADAAAAATNVDINRLPTEASVTVCRSGELSPATDSFLIQMTCGNWAWECWRFYTDFIELRMAGRNPLP